MSILESPPIWIVGDSCCGKTTRLASLMVKWLETSSFLEKPLILCANGESKKTLIKILLSLNSNSYQTKIKTPLALMMEDVILFYPLLCQQLNLPSQLPIRLRPETEQELATQLWQSSLNVELIGIFGNEYNCVRRILDFLQLATAEGISPEKIGDRLLESKIININKREIFINLIQELILQWRKWCLEKGLLSYGLIYELYGLYLLPNNYYQSYLKDNYQAIFADDVDDYPAMMADLAKVFLTEKKTAVFTYNQNGKISLGLGADPQYLQELAKFCHQESLVINQINSLRVKVETLILEIINQGYTQQKIIDNVRHIINDNSRGDLLNQTAEFIVKSIKSGEIQADEIVIIAPGLDEIARYTIINYLKDHGIEVKPINEQRPLITSPLIRSTLTLLTLLYQGNGRLLEKEMITEMLVILSWENIDLVRGGLLVDYCYSPDINYPSLLTVQSFPRWDRLTYQSLESYNQIREWIDKNREKINRGNNHLLAITDDILEHFFLKVDKLNYSQLATLREFRETAQHFWEIQQRLKNHQINDILRQLIHLLRKGTISANPLPMAIIPPLTAVEPKAVAMASVYQYRSLRTYHRWQFWLDVGSNYWSQSGELLASPIFLKSWKPNSNAIGEELESENERIIRIIQDLLARVTEKIFFCYSELDVKGNEQIGKLSALVDN
ncbi:recombinase family protein [Geminocystis sp. GBBB08]|uniref:recombinase family protein n=1 Tax=Geminocystis sp. GBBB08 TaxID=2604140 RepID=UPI0027E33D9D|nr:recombinase family protein [Geminocystis sp. GBBB08]MBL1209075.1 recombinase family protein [Geminocystis sp. GBBB08]